MYLKSEYLTAFVIRHNWRPERPAFRIGGVKILSVMIPFVLDDPATISAAVEAGNKASVPVSFSTAFSASNTGTIAALREVLEKGRPVDIDVQTSGLVGTSLEDLLTKATEDLKVVPPIILCE